MHRGERLLYGWELDVHEMTIKHVLPLLVRVRTTDQVIAALRG